MIRTNSTNPAIIAAVETVNDVMERIAQDGELIEAGVIEVASSDAQAPALWKYWEAAEEGLPRGVELVQGSILGYPHSWFQLRLPIDRAGLPNWRWVIDPAAPRCIPNALVLAPDCPLRLCYFGEVVAGAPLYPMPPEPTPEQLEADDQPACGGGCCAKDSER